MDNISIEESAKSASFNFWIELCKDAKIYFSRNALTQDGLEKSLEYLTKRLTEKEKKYLEDYISASDIEECADYFTDKKLPVSYINFLKFTNISEMQNGERRFQFLTIQEIRDYTIGYIFPKWLNGAVTFAMDGGGFHYVFDMRQDSINGEYPIYAVSSGNPGWNKDEAFFLGNSFIEIIADKKDIYSIAPK